MQLHFRFLRHTLLSSISLLGTLSSHANNITTSAGSLTGNTGTQVFVKFNVTWQNSWRINPDRWDAAWVFVKYRTANGLWQHASLENTGHVAPSGSTITTGLLTPGTAFNATTNPGMGAFIYRSADGSGTFTANNVQLLWNYAANGVSIGDVLEVRVFAIEMVYVPQGAFYVGSGGTESGSFTDGSWVSGATIPYQINTEGAITIGQIAGNLWGNSSIGDRTIGPAGTLPAAYPKGFGGFYCMKYELTQQGYVDFLNTLTYTQQVTRTATAPNSAAGTGALSSTNLDRSGIDIQSAGVASTTPAVYACNFDADATYGEATDGKDIACNFLTWGDLSAYLDWSGQRPMTELEFEKACRGTNAPVPSECPWGTAIAGYGTGTLTNAGAANEGIATNYSTTGGNASFSSASIVLRVGIFAANASNSGRVSAGASYYGIMELAGNVSESAVSVGTTGGRSFTGTHGNGDLAASGDPDAATWPAPTAPDGLGKRGGSIILFPFFLTVSSRDASSGSSGGRGSSTGGRGVRSAP